MLPSLTYSQDTLPVSGFPCFFSCLVLSRSLKMLPSITSGYSPSEWLSMFLVLSCPEVQRCCLPSPPVRILAQGVAFHVSCLVLSRGLKKFPSLTSSQDTRPGSGFPCFLSCLVQRFKDVAFPHWSSQDTRPVSGFPCFLSCLVLSRSWKTLPSLTYSQYNRPVNGFPCFLSCLVLSRGLKMLPSLTYSQGTHQWVAFHVSCLVLSCPEGKRCCLSLPTVRVLTSEWLSMFLFLSCLVQRFKDIAFHHWQSRYIYLVSSSFSFLLKLTKFISFAVMFGPVAFLKVLSNQIRFAWEWYHWIVPEKDHQQLCVFYFIF